MSSSSREPPALERFTGYLRDSERSPATIRSYRSDIRAFEMWFEEANDCAAEPENITPTDLREYKRFLLEAKTLRPNTVNRKLASLRSYLGWAASAGLIADGRMPTMPKAVRSTRPGPRWLDRRERRALVKAVERMGSPRDQGLVKILLNTGLRVGELCSLTWRDVIVRPRKGRVIVRQGKGHKHREVPLSKEARETFLMLGYEGQAGSEEPVFTGQRGPMTPRGVHNALGRYFRVAGLEDATPHSLRHTFCKSLVDTGAGLHEVAALAGHESLETTRRYCTPSLSDLQRTVNLLGEST